MRLQAKWVAIDLMLGSARRDWSAWRVEIYDAAGRSIEGWEFKSAQAGDFR